MMWMDTRSANNNDCRHPFRIRSKTNKKKRTNEENLWWLSVTIIITIFLSSSPSSLWIAHDHRPSERNNKCNYYVESFSVISQPLYIQRRASRLSQGYFYYTKQHSSLQQLTESEKKMKSLKQCTDLVAYSTLSSLFSHSNPQQDIDESSNNNTYGDWKNSDSSSNSSLTITTQTTKSSAPTISSSSSYRFWEEPMTTESFNMDLLNIAMEDAQKAQDALEIMSEKYEKQQQQQQRLGSDAGSYNHGGGSGGGMYVKPNTASYTTVIEGWLNSPVKEQQRDAAYQIQYLFDTMEQSEDSSIKPNAVTYMLVCQAWAEHTNDRKTGYAPEQAELILQKMKNHGYIPNVKVYTSIINSWCRVSGVVRGAMDHVEQLLTEMETLSPSSTNNEGGNDTTSTLVSTINQNTATNDKSNDTTAATSSPSSSKTDTASATASDDISTNDSGTTTINDQIEWHEFPDGVATAVIPQYSPSANKRTRQNENRGNRNNNKKYSQDSIRPNVITYTAVIGGYARSKGRNLASKAEAILDRMERNGVVPDMVAYTSVLNAWSKATSYHERKLSATKSLAMISKMERLYIEEEQYHMKPNPITYAACINAIGNSLDWNSGTMAEDVLRRMYTLANTTMPSVKPQTNTYNAVITAYARNTNRKNGRMNAQKAESLLVEMTKRSQQGEFNIQPNVRTWSGVMSAWAASREKAAAINAQRVLDNLEQLHELGQTTVRPNCVCFTTVMSAWSTSRRPDAVSRTEQLLFRMEKRFLDTGDKDVRPNAITYVTLINAFIKDNPKDAGPRAQKTVNRMMRLYLQDRGFLKPSRMVFNSLINAWSKSEDPSSAKHAERILEWMERQYNDGDAYFKPDDVTFCGVLNAWANHAKNGGAHRAQQLLDHMEHLTTQERGFQPSIICYNIVIKAWARSGEPDAVQRGEQILKRLESNNRDDGLRPDITTYSSVINCCAYYNIGGNTQDDEHGKQEAFRVAMTTFHKLCNSTATATGSTRGGSDDGVKPNHVTYGTLLKAINNLVSPVDRDGRERLLRSIFKKCCQDGQVDAFVLTQLRNGCSTKTYRELVQLPTERTSSLSSRVDEQSRGGTRTDVILRQLPNKWTCNVPKFN